MALVFISINVPAVTGKALYPYSISMPHISINGYADLDKILGGGGSCNGLAHLEVTRLFSVPPQLSVP